VNVTNPPVWINPPNRYSIHQVGRKAENEIIQNGEIDDKGHQSRWVYRDITPDSFRWCNEKTVDQGDNWILMQEMRAKRL
jgi:hypothetical protein